MPMRSRELTFEPLNKDVKVEYGKIKGQKYAAKQPGPRIKEPEPATVSGTGEAVAGEPGVAEAASGRDVGEAAERAGREPAREFGERPAERPEPGRGIILSEAERDELLAFSGKGGKAGAEGRGILDEYFTPLPVAQRLWVLADFTRLS